VEPRVGGANAEPTGRQAEVERRDQRPEAEPQDPVTRVRLVLAQTSQQGITREGEGLQASSRGGAGGLAELCGDDDRGKLDEINGANSNSHQVINTSSMLVSTSDDEEQTDGIGWEAVPPCSNPSASPLCPIPPVSSVLLLSLSQTHSGAPAPGAMVGAVPSSSGFFVVLFV